MTQTSQRKPISAPASKAQRVFVAQRAAAQGRFYPGKKEREDRLARLERIILEHTDRIATAVSQDFGVRPTEETKILELFPALDNIRFTRKRLTAWMKPRRRKVSLLFAGAQNWVTPQPKGVVGIVVPWNYPVLLMFAPLTSALAAGNRCMIKMAANSHNLRKLLAGLFADYFSEDEVAILPDVDKKEFSSLPFDHLLFTGSAQAGRKVMEAAAQNLTPVTLELGGKSPVIICDDFDLKKAAKRIAYAKLLNAGQTCLAPDYVFVPEQKRAAFVALLEKAAAKLYPHPDRKDYTAIIDQKSYERLRFALDDAKTRGAAIMPLVPGASFNDERRIAPPHCIVDVTGDMQIMREEIFGPLLPVLTYQRLEQPIAHINANDRPLGLYLFTNNKKNIRTVLASTLSGGVSINNCIMHVVQHDLPFGGTGESGMGQYHAQEGFLEFSKLRPVYRESKISGLSLLYPPYTRLHRAAFDVLARFKR